MMVYSCTVFHENIFHGKKVIFIAKISKGHNFLKNVGGVTVLFLCTSSDDGSYLYKVS